MYTVANAFNLFIICPMRQQHWTDYKISLCVESVSEWVSEWVSLSHKTSWTLYRSQSSTDVHQTCHQGRFPGDEEIIVCGGDPKYFRPPCTSKSIFGENHQLKPMESVSAYFLTTYKAIVTKLDQTIKEIELHKNLQSGTKGVTRVTWPTLKLWDPLHISGRVEARNFNFGMQIGHYRGPKQKMQN